jgi:TolB-like protein/class 3 adenylate cyclase/Flp pilus assembly protein TadD
MKRRLAAILAADVAGYSRLMEVDEEATLRTLKEFRETIDMLIARHDGRVFGSAGDSVIAEFASPVEAVRCAVEIQEENGKRNGNLPEDRRMRFRIGVNLGDVMADGDNLFGDGVNLAARLEGLAEPGGICVSEAIHAQVRKTLDLGFEFMGNQQVKNIAEKVPVYRVQMGAGAAPGVAGAKPRQWRRMALAAAAVVIAGGVAMAIWGPFLRPSPPPANVASGETPAVILTDRPSIAVLPFVNISGDDEQEYFSDGMTEDLITDLSKISGLTVISRTSTSGYKGKKIDIREVGEALDVRYVLEGSVRKAGEQVRINAQLIDATTGGHLWAERYDGDLNDIFSLQDQVLEKIVGSLALRLSEMERQRLAAKGTDSVTAHDLYLRGLFQESTFTREGNREAMGLYEQALSIDPDYALPYARMANILELSARNGWSNDIRADLAKAVELAEKAVVLDPQDPNIHWSLGRVVARLQTPEALERSIKSLERAIELDPNFADAYAFLTVLYVADGRAGDGLKSVETAMRINPRYPFWYLFMRGTTRYVVEDYESAIADFEAAAERSPTAPFVRWWLAASYAQAGQMEDAEWQVEELQLMGFEGTITTILETGHIQDPGYLSLYREGMRKAGIPE